MPTKFLCFYGTCKNTADYVSINQAKSKYTFICTEHLCNEENPETLYCRMTHRRFRIVETDNFGGDYPNESFHGPHMKYDECETVADIFNAAHGPDGSRFYKVVHDSYKLQPGFEP